MIALPIAALSAKCFRISDDTFSLIKCLNSLSKEVGWEEDVHPST